MRSAGSSWRRVAVQRPRPRSTHTRQSGQHRPRQRRPGCPRTHGQDRGTNGSDRGRPGRRVVHYDDLISIGESVEISLADGDEGITTWATVAGADRRTQKEGGTASVHLRTGPTFAHRPAPTEALIRRSGPERRRESQEIASFHRSHPMAPSRLTSIDLHNRRSVDGGSHQQRKERSDATGVRVLAPTTAGRSPRRDTPTR